MSNVLMFPTTYTPAESRVVERISLDEFVAADETKEWSSRHFVNGMTVLQSPMGILICDADARCTAIRPANVDIEDGLSAALARLA